MGGGREVVEPHLKIAIPANTRAVAKMNNAVVRPIAFAISGPANDPTNMHKFNITLYHAKYAGRSFEGICSRR